MSSRFTPQEMKRAQKLLANPDWRINNLYQVIDKDGQKITFKLKWAQQDLYRNMWYNNIILKGRQLGISSFLSILFLDRCFFNSNMQAGIIAHTREDSEVLFRKIKFAYDSMPEQFKKYRPIETDTVRELKFDNGSSLRVGTSMRSSTLNYLHISEFGYICAHYPDKAQEIISGSLNTVGKGQYVFIESTAEGSGGHFYDMCQRSIKAEREKIRLTEMDYKFHFYPWWKEDDYKLGLDVPHPQELKEYYQKLESKQIFLGGNQMSWYTKKWETLGDAIYSEYPSTPEEAFQASASGLFYGKLLTEARLQKRVGHIPYDNHTLVYTSWDIGFGVSGYNAIWFFQICGNEIHFIDFYQDFGKSLAEYIQFVKSKPYTYGGHIAPHDIEVHEYTHGYSRWEVALKLGIEFLVAPKLQVIEGIEAVKSQFPKMWFDEEKCKEGIRMLENYRKQWDERLCKWSEKEVKDETCHAADSLRMACTGLPLISSDYGSIETDRKAFDAFLRHK